MKTWRDLIKAVRVKVQLGWVQNRSHRYRPEAPTQYCIMGALAAIGSDSKCHAASYNAAVRRIAAVVRRRDGEYRFGESTAIMQFNDAAGTTQEDVLKVLDEASEGK